MHSRQERWSWDEDKVSLVRPKHAAKVVTLRAEPESVQVDLSRSALIVIDMQNDFLDPNGWFSAVRGAPVEQLKSALLPINAIARAFRHSNVPVIHLNWGVRADLANLPANVLDIGSACGTQPGYGDAMANGRVLVSGTWGASSVDDIIQESTDITVSKHRLSGFRDNELEQILRRLDVSTIFYTGVNLDRCVFATLMDGCFQGFDAILVEDATATVSPGSVVDAITYLIRMLYGFTTTSAEIISALDNDNEQVKAP